MTDNFSVLLVDDDVNTQDLFRIVTDYCGFELHIETDLPGTLKSLDTHAPNVVVLDIYLPNTDGYSVLQAIHKTLVKCPVVATTAYYTSDTFMQMKQAGFHDCLFKPIEASSLMSYLSGFTQPTL
jgi:two-component system, NtrC family, nitrogen regulation response regulator NtrX